MCGEPRQKRGTELTGQFPIWEPGTTRKGSVLVHAYRYGSVWPYEEPTVAKYDPDPILCLSIQHRPLNSASQIGGNDFQFRHCLEMSPLIRHRRVDRIEEVRLGD